MGDFRCVFDVNVLVSALLFKASTPRKALDLALDRGHLLLSMPILLELNDVLSRSKFDKYFDEADKNAFLGMLFREAKLEEDLEPVDVCRDPKDNMLLELAVTGEAEFLITGDTDLLILSPFRAIEILTPDQFLARDPA